MTFLFFIVGGIAAYFTWKYLSKNRIGKGDGKIISHLVGGIAGFLVWTIIIAIAATKSENINTPKNEQKEVAIVESDTYINTKKLSEELIKPISPDILSASVQMQYAGEYKGLNNIDIEIESSSWSGVQAWNSVAIKVFNLSKKLFARSDIGKITFVIWDGDHSNTWARVEVSRNYLPDKWSDLTYLQFFSYSKLDILTTQGEEWLNEFYSEYSSAVPK